MAKLCIIYNTAPIYREAIFRDIDNEYDCEWFFGDNITDIKSLPNDALKSISFTDNKHILGPFYRQPGFGALIRKKRFSDYLVLGDPFNLSVWWLLIQKNLFFRRKRVFLWSHGWYGREGLLKKWMKRIFFGFATHTFTYGEYAKSQAILQGFDGSKITPIHNSLNYKYQSYLRDNISTQGTLKDYFKDDNPTLIFIGRLTFSKQLEMVLKALALLREKGKYFNFVMVGDGEARTSLETLTSDLSLTNNVCFFGSCYDDSKTAQLIYESDLCVSPGNIGLTAIHSLTFGTPAITHNDFPYQGPEFEAIVPDKTGAFFKKGDVDSLAESILNWTNDHPDRETVRKSCIDVIDSSWTPEFQLKTIKSVISR